MPDSISFPGLVAAALLLEAAAGYPGPLFRAIRHPVVWAGALIGWLDRTLNQEGLPPADRRSRGALAVAVLLAASAGPAWVLQGLLPWPLLVVLAATLPAQRSLHAYVAAVGDALRDGGLPAGRRAVAHIVGRNPDTLDAAAVLRAAIDSLAENFSDGVVAPPVWGLTAGLPGMAAYKALNTADSMIGHLTPRHRAFGWAAARLDDLVNLPASRLSVLWLVLAAAVHRGASPGAALRAVRRDAWQHRSPNAGWPEAAMAGALGLRLAGPRTYGTVIVADAWMGDGRPAATLDDLRRALALYRTACAMQVGAVLLLWAALSVRG